GDGRPVHQPADRTYVRPGQRGVVEDRRVLLAPGVQLVEQLVAGDAESFGRGVEIQAVPGFVLHLGQQDRLAPQAGRPADPVAFRLHADDLGVRVLGDLADQRATIRLGHVVARLDSAVGVDDRVERRFLLVAAVHGARLCGACDTCPAYVP